MAKKLTTAECQAMAIALEECSEHLGLAWTDDPTERAQGDVLAHKLQAECAKYRQLAFDRGMRKSKIKRVGNAHDVGSVRAVRNIDPNEQLKDDELRGLPPAVIKQLSKAAQARALELGLLSCSETMTNTCVMTMLTGDAQKGNGTYLCGKSAKWVDPLTDNAYCGTHRRTVDKINALKRLPLCKDISGLHPCQTITKN